MNVTGDKSKFAIEWVVTAAYEQDCYGAMCFWIGGDKVGDLDYEVHLDASIYHCNQFLRHKNIRAYRNSHALPKEKLFYQLFEKFFGEKAKATGDYLHLGIYRAIFGVDEVGDLSIMDKWNIIVLDEPEVERQRIIWRRLDAPDDKHEAFLPGNLFDEVVQEYCKQVATQWQQQKRRDQCG